MAAELDDKIRTLTRERNEREAVLASMVEGVLAVDPDGRVHRPEHGGRPSARRRRARRARHAASRRSSAIPSCSASCAHVAGRRGSPVEADLTCASAREERFLQANGSLLHDRRRDGLGAVVVLQRRDPAAPPRGGAPRLRRQRLARAQDAGDLDQGLRRDAAGRRHRRPRGRRSASCASSPGRPTA